MFTPSLNIMCISGKVVAYCEGTVGFDFSIAMVGIFLAGFFSGRYITLWTYTRLIQYISGRSSLIALWLNRIITILFFVLALVQAFMIHGH